MRDLAAEIAAAPVGAMSSAAAAEVKAARADVSVARASRSEVKAGSAVKPAT